MKISYEFETSGNRYSDYTDEDFSDTEYYDYEPTDNRIEEAIDYILSFKSKEELVSIIKDNIDSCGLYEIYEDEFKDYFYDDAKQEFENKE